MVISGGVSRRASCCNVHGRGPGAGEVGAAGPRASPQEGLDTRQEASFAWTWGCEAHPPRGSWGGDVTVVASFTDWGENHMPIRGLPCSVRRRWGQRGDDAKVIECKQRTLQSPRRLTWSRIGERDRTGHELHINAGPHSRLCGGPTQLIMALYSFSAQEHRSEIAGTCVGARWRRHHYVQYGRCPGTAPERSKPRWMAGNLGQLHLHSSETTRFG